MVMVSVILNSSVAPAQAGAYVAYQFKPISVMDISLRWGGAKSQLALGAFHPTYGICQNFSY
jgi:hypothetical protein